MIDSLCSSSFPGWGVINPFEQKPSTFFSPLKAFVFKE
tara:strand:- start:349 stop:462 length:114 start_codon:yes stop_codon:yes gene_type:complete